MATKKQLDQQGSALAGIFSAGKPEKKEEKKPAPKKAPAPAKGKKTHLNIDITDSQEYLKLISFYRDMSMSAYIADLIAKDQKKNRALYEKLLEAKEQMKEAESRLKGVKA